MAAEMHCCHSCIMWVVSHPLPPCARSASRACTAHSLKKLAKSVPHPPVVSMANGMSSACLRTSSQYLESFLASTAAAAPSERSQEALAPKLVREVV